MALKITAVNGSPNLEYALYGSVLENHVNLLLDRLKGLCGTLPGNGDPFHDHYLTYCFRHVAPPVTVRAVRSLLFTSVPWRLQYYGTELAEVNQLVTQRQIIDTCCSVKLPQFLDEGLGFSLESEYVMKGHSFAKDRVKILVGRVMKTSRDSFGVVEGAEPVKNSFLVEVSAIAFGGVTNEPYAKDVAQFVELLKPMVKMEKMDFKRMS